MDTVPETIELIRNADSAIIESSVVTLTRKLAQSEIDTKWWQIPEVSKGTRSQENDHGWQWAKRLGELRDDRWHSALAVQTDDGRIQGAILYHLDTRSFIETDAGAVYIEAVATAPRNRPWLVSTPVYRGVGSGLLLCAVMHSYKLGLGGRVNLLSAEDSRTIEYYKRRGFAPAGYDDDAGNEPLPRFELDTDSAQSWLREEGYEL